MIQINKSEVQYLLDKGYKFGEMLHKGAGKVKRYYATEDYRLMRELKKYRDSIRG